MQGPSDPKSFCAVKAGTCTAKRRLSLRRTTWAARYSDGGQAAVFGFELRGNDRADGDLLVLQSQSVNNYLARPHLLQ
jgi:hypothetical protein